MAVLLLSDWKPVPLRRAVEVRRPEGRGNPGPVWAPVLLTVTIACVVIGPGCRRNEPVRAARSREIMGTLATVTAVARDLRTASAAVEAGYSRLEDVNRLMSDYVDDSEIGRLNRFAGGPPLPVSAETYECVRRAVEFGRLTGGAFDLTCRPLIELWRKAAARGRLPTDPELAEARSRVGWDRVRLDTQARAIALPQAGMQIDLGGIAKGYALDLAAEAMRKAGAQAALVEVGGDVVAAGCSPEGRPWRVGVKHPFQTGLLLVLELSDRAVATSGVQQRFFEIEGRRFSHIVDPRTGQPARQAPSVTVIAQDGITADAWATALSVLSVEEGRQLLAAGTAPGVEAMWVSGSSAEPIITRTPGFEAYVAP